ncbi:SDR family oxidoreductase [Chelativorans salis]|uniref:SDR family oxidoreductase n=1 Tax=Chelativorans salis TaxID=2978478 RepID=A0ABT2LLR7_9HYPH|nr:SDR family oxidoreductase [Chelativorans sp. EGI FJ00035]MCT7374608.1 SDR family oxidoreductase [Chelativorans sp. EGI FJ00035]
MAERAIIVGGTQGIGLEIARKLLARGDEVIITGRDRARAEAVAAELGSGASGLGLDLSEPHTIAAALAGIPGVRHVVITAILRDANSVREYDVARAISLVTLKLVGYTEAIHALLPSLEADASIVLFGGLAKERPYPGSTTVTTVNGGVSTLVHTLAVELAPVRVNAIHPGIIGDSPAWKDKNLDNVIARTPTKRLATMQDVAGTALFLLDNQSINGVNLNIDNGWLLT